LELFSNKYSEEKAKVAESTSLRPDIQFTGSVTSGLQRNNIELKKAMVSVCSFKDREKVLRKDLAIPKTSIPLVV